MTRIGVTLCACALLLGGCMSSGKAVRMHHYTLRRAPATTSSAHATGRAGCGSLAIARINVPAWLAGTGMYYRLDYQQDNELTAYGYSDWVAPPATLLEPIIQRAIAAGSCWRAVVGPRNPASADATLYLRIDDFSQAFAGPGQSTGVIDATATLINNQSRDVIAQRPFHLEEPAASADARGGADALGKASHQLATRLAHWLQTAVGHAANTGH